MTPQEVKLIPEITKVITFAATSFIFSMAVTPIYTYFAYKFKWWKQISDTSSLSGGKEKTPVFYKLHKDKHKRHIPTMAGIIIWGVVGIITLAFNLDRAQTYLLLFTLVSVGLLGLIDDYLNIRSTGGIAGVKSKFKFAWSLAIAGVGSWWFYAKLGWSVIHIPAYGDLNIGWLYIPLFILVIVATANAVNITDGLDGLSGGLLMGAFGAFALIAFFQGNVGIAIFCATVVGAMLSYTWFNIFPARFFMGDTGAVALGATLGVIALLTNSVIVLPIIGFVFMAETLSVIVQVFSKKIFKKKIFLSTPIHHHFEAKGWPETKVTMRFWIIGGVMATIGTIIGLLGRGI